MSSFTIHQAKTNLSKLIARVEAGEDVVITRGKTPVARLTAVSNAKPKLKFGALKGKFKSPPDAFFFDPLPEEELRLWEGEDEDSVR